MKKYILIILSFSLILIVSCEKVLEVEPTESLSAEQAIQNSNDVSSALAGCYDGLQRADLYGLDRVSIPDLAADNLDHSGTRQEYGQIDNNAILAENFLIEGIWNSSYEALNRINSLLEKLPEISDMTEAEKSSVTGQLLFMRALLHFDLVNFFGAVPVKTQPTTGVDETLDVPRDDVETVYNQIITDLNNARNTIGMGDNSYATDGAVLALLARVYLYMEQWNDARNAASDVLAMSAYQLEADYNNLFSGGASPEIIFKVAFDAQDRNTLAYYYFPTSEEGRNEFTPGESLLDAFETNDSVRENASIAEGGYGYKYRDITNGTDNVIVLRLAEMYLIRAEAEAQLNGSIQAIQDDINAVRNRAGLGNTTAASYGDLKAAIEQERRIEFAFEGHRWFDLIRTGKALETLEMVTSPNQLLFPIPTSEINANTNPGMYQNPGY